MNDKTGLYRLFRYSPIYEWTARLRGSSYAQMVANDRCFFKLFFKVHRIRHVFDVGANVGDKTQVFVELADRVLCLEADPTTAATLDFRFARNGKISIENVAVGRSIGTAKMYRKSYSGFNTLSEKWSQSVGEVGVREQDEISVPVTTLDSLITKYGVPDYVKIDVEGYELPVVESLNHPLRALSFEANLPAFLPETQLIVDKLLSQQPDLHFNFRCGDGPSFVLSKAVSSKTLFPILSELGHATCDIFALARDPTCES